MKNLTFHQFVQRRVDYFKRSCYVKDPTCRRMAYLQLGKELRKRNIAPPSYCEFTAQVLSN